MLDGRLFTLAWLAKPTGRRRVRQRYAGLNQPDSPVTFYTISYIYVRNSLRYLHHQLLMSVIYNPAFQTVNLDSDKFQYTTFRLTLV